MEAHLAVGASAVTVLASENSDSEKEGDMAKKPAKGRKKVKAGAIDLTSRGAATLVSLTSTNSATAQAYILVMEQNSHDAQSWQYSNFAYSAEELLALTCYSASKQPLSKLEYRAVSSVALPQPIPPCQRNSEHNLPEAGVVYGVVRI